MLPEAVTKYVNLDTTAIDNFFPGFAKHYGPGRPVMIELDLLRLGSFDAR